jgi:hypothetical protein
MIPKGYSEVLNCRNTENIMTKRKRTIKETMIYRTLHRKLKDWAKSTSTAT